MYVFDPASIFNQETRPGPVHAPSVKVQFPVIPAKTEGWRDRTIKSITGCGIACVGLVAKSGRNRRAHTACRFFGGAAARTYRDYSDPWLSFADVGFDPLNLAVQGGVFDSASTAVPETTYYNYRESEIKHGRFAMGAFLAIAGERNDTDALLNQLGVPGYQDNLDATLGLDEYQAPLLFLALGIQALAEYNLQRQETDGNQFSVQYNRNRMPGDLGFDPLNFSAVGDRKTLHNLEMNSGRLAMIGITVFLVREYLKM